jgi:hypothetical protein
VVEQQLSQLGQVRIEKKATPEQNFCAECGHKLPKVVQLEEAESDADLQ